MWYRSPHRGACKDRVERPRAFSRLQLSCWPLEYDRRRAWRRLFARPWNWIDV